jgi:murein DD-endopeptidase MepM/ murein hydrolase activator NlpD
MLGQASRGYAPDENSPSMRHYGLDIAGHEGSPVFATAAGVVEFAGWDEAMGNTIIIDHGTGYKTIYGHNSVIMCEAEQKVNCGEMICLSGNSGRSSAPHLHYEIRFNNQPVDPLGFILTDSTKALAGRSPAP